MLHLIQIIVVAIALALVLIIILALGTSFIVAVFGGGPFVPTKILAVKKILREAGIKKGQILYDIGAGDGRFLHYAEKLYGAHATGFEIDPFIYSIAKLKQILLGWKGVLYRDNFQNHSLKNADIVICYMLPETLKKYQKKFDKELQKGTKVISYTFHIGSWIPYKEIPADKSLRIKKIFIYKIRSKKAKPLTKKKTISKTT